ncbi:MAG: RDD family protein [Candidatus Thiodiazotropha sp.]
MCAVPAARWRRLIAFVIDVAVWSLVLIPAVRVVMSGDEAHIGAMIMNSFTGWVGVTGINLYLLHARSQTIGKWVMQLQIRRRDASHAGLTRKLLLRYLLPGLLLAIPYLGPLLLAIDLASLFSADRRTLHDRLADTQVFPYPRPESG